VGRNVLTRFLTWGTGTILPVKEPIQAYKETKDFHAFQRPLEEKGWVK
jgi:hypothetical protein